MEERRRLVHVMEELGGLGQRLGREAGKFNGGKAAVRLKLNMTHNQIELLKRTGGDLWASRPPERLREEKCW